jgi:TldD protein
LFDADDTGLAVRVIVDGTWGFASAVDLTADAAAQVARQAVEVARVAAAMNTEPIELAPEPAYGDVTWVSDYDVDPFTVSVADKVERLAQWSRDLLAHSAVSHVDASLQQVRECKFYCDGATTATRGGSGSPGRTPAGGAPATAGSTPCERWRLPSAGAMSSSPEPAGTSRPN